MKSKKSDKIKNDSTGKIIQSSSQSLSAEEFKDTTAQVLYQKMGDRWFAFSVIDDEVFVGSISNEDLRGPDVGKGNA